MGKGTSHRFAEPFSILFVPDLSVNPAKTILKSSSTFLADIIVSYTNSLVLTYEYGLRQGDAIWDSLSAASEKLIEHLLVESDKVGVRIDHIAYITRHSLTMIFTSQVRNCPNAFICHGLGGLVVKEVQDSFFDA